MAQNPEKSSGNTSGNQAPKKSVSAQTARKVGSIALGGKK